MDKITKITKELESKVVDLLFPSESEYPCTVVQWHGQEQNFLLANKTLSNEAFRQITGHAEDILVNVKNIKDFFQQVTTVEEWHSEAEKLSVTRFTELMNYLIDTFDEIQVFKVGEFEIDVYILGIIDSHLIGIQTKIVET
jgi:hypothetical protein